MGEKDFQQLFLVKKFLKNKYNTDVIGCKTIRKKNKVALSSRNNLLSKENLALASIIVQRIDDPDLIRHICLNTLRMYNKKYREEYGQMVFESAGPEGRTTVDRCLVGFVAGPPMIPGSYNNNMQIVQTKDQIMILNEMVHSARIIRLDSEHNTKQLKWEGDSVAYWEEDTLVIHTQNWYHDYNLRGMSKQAVVEERIKRIDESTLEYDFTVNDPLSWDEPWSAKFPLRASTDPIYEYACHEGNHGLVGILAGWRYQEAQGNNGDGSPKSETGVVETEEN